MSLRPAFRVNGIAPGAIETPSTVLHHPKRRYVQGNRSLDTARTARTSLTILRWQRCILHRHASGFVSGKIIEVDGGMAALPGTAIEAKIARSMASEPDAAMRSNAVSKK